MENEFLNQNRLTTDADSPKLNGGDIFMANEGEAVPKAVDATPPDADKAPAEEGVSPVDQRQPPVETTGASGRGEGPPPPENPQGGEDNGRKDVLPTKRSKTDMTEQDYRDAYNQDPEKFMGWLRAQSPHSEYLDPALVSFLARLPNNDDRPLMYMVNKILALPLDNETADYRLGLAADSNREAIFAQLKEAWRSEDDEGRRAILRNRDNKVRQTYEALSLMHEMNRAIATAKIEDFSKMAAGITPEQQQILQDVKGAAQIMRLFEDEYQRLLMDEQRVTTEKNDELLGKSIKIETPNQRARAVGIVEGRLLDLINYVKSRNDIPANSPLGQLASLEAWEVGWAFNAGKLLYNLSLRAAEQISLSEVPSGDAAWRSPPQEHMVRIMNQVAWIWQRFSKGDTVGGKEYLERVQAHYKALRERHGYGKTGMSKLAGKKIEDYEISSMFKVSGIFSSWRNRAIILEKAPMVIDGKKTSISTYIKEARAREMDRLKGQYGGRKDFDKFIKTKEAEILRAIYLNENGELRPEFTNALGVLLSYGHEDGKLVPAEKDTQFPGLLETKKQIRAEIWRRISQDNPLAVAYFLKGMEFENGKAPHFHHGNEADFKAFNARLDTQKDKLWGGEVGEGDEAKHVKGLREKLIMAREIRLARLAKGEKASLDDVLAQMDGEYSLNGEEKTFLEEIRAYGKDVSNDLASVRLPFNPFMTDVVFEEADYKSAGSNYYSRRIGDIGGIYNSYEGFTKIIGQAGVISREEAMKALKEAISALDGPNGWGTSQDEALPFFMALLDFWEAGGQHRDLRGEGGSLKSWFAKDNLFGPIAHQLRIPNSVAQKYGGTDAIAYDEFAMWGVLNEAYATGITRKDVKGKDGYVDSMDIDDFLRKKKKLKFGGFMVGILLAVFRDLTKVFLIAAVYEGFKQTKKQEK